MMKRQTLLGGAAALVILAGLADVLLCTALRHTLGGRFKHWAQDVRAQGYTLTYGPLRNDGFPWGARLVVPSLSLSGGRAVLPGGVDWHAERVVLSLALLAPTRLTVEPEGEQVLRAAGGDPVAFFAERFSAEVPLTDERLDRIDIEAEGLAGGPRRPGHLQDVRIGALRASLQADRAGASRTTARLSLSARQIGLPDDGRWALGATITRLDADISLASPALSGESPAEQARAWHDWGGLLTVEALSMRWGPLDVRAVAELGLDDELQPAGTGTARVRGAEAALDALSRSGILSPGVAQTGKVVLALMPTQTDDDGTARILPFTLQDSTLSVGKTPLMHVGDIAWGK